MRKAFVLIAAFTMMSLVAPAAPSVAASVPEVITVSAPSGANQPCPKNTVKVFTATVNIRHGFIVRPGTFALDLKNGATRTIKGSVVAGTKRRDAEYFVFVGRKARVRTGSHHTYQLGVNNSDSLYTVQLTQDCLEKAA